MWAAVSEGAELAPLRVEVTITTMVKAVAGTRDLYPIHHDPEFARTHGARDIFLNTMWYQGLIGRYLTDWAGSEAFLRRLSIQMRDTNGPGDTLTVRGTVGAKRREHGRRLLDLEVRVHSQRRDDTVLAEATIDLGDDGPR